MGRKSREKPARLGDKLLQIRLALELSQSQMLRLIRGEEEDRTYRHLISEYESGKRAPSLLEVLAYARAAGISMEKLVDDKLDLPKRIPPLKRRAKNKDG